MSAFAIEERIERLERVCGLVPEVAPLPIGGLTVRRIARACCERFDIGFEELIGPARHKYLMRARCAVCWIARRHTTRSLEQIAAALNRSDHSTMLNRVEVAERLMAEDEGFRLAVLEIRDALIKEGAILP